jgi:hypothetical protein
MRTSTSFLAAALTASVLPTVAAGQDGLDSVTTSVEYPEDARAKPVPLLRG